MKWIAVAMGAVVMGVAAAIVFVGMLRPATTPEATPEATLETTPEATLEATPEATTAAIAGNASAPAGVQGTSTADDNDVPGDEPAVLRMLREAAERGDADAQYMLGYMYAHGDGVAEDDAEAVRWFRLAAEQGVTEAHTALGLSYTRGEGVPEDLVTGYAWLTVAAEQGESSAKVGRGLLNGVLTEDQIAEARIRSREYRTRYVDPFQ